MRSLPVLILLIAFITSMEYKVNKKFHYCKKSNKTIDLDKPCHDANCVEYKNAINLYSKLKDEFNYVYIPKNEKTGKLL